MPLVMKRLKDAGLLHAGAQTVTGHTVGEIADGATEDRGPARGPAAATIRSSRPAASRSSRGNLAPEGCVVKLAGHERLTA